MDLRGLFIGKVEQRVDPMRQGRIRVRVAGIHADEIDVDKLPWAYPKSIAAWEKGGFFAIPPLGSFVWVSFINGDHEYPVWDGSWWKNAKGTEASDGKKASEHAAFPTCWFGGERGTGILKMEQFPEVKEVDQPNNYGFTSPNNKRWELDDRKKRERMVFGDQIDNIAYINSEHGVVTLEAGRGLRTGETYRKHGITLTSNDEDKLHGVQVYTHKNWRLTVDDTLGYFDVSSQIGHKIRINTSVEGSEREDIQIWTARGDRIVLSQTEQVVSVVTAGGRKLVLRDGEGGGFQVSTTAGHVFADDATNTVEVFSAGKLALKASGDLSISAAGRLTLDGSDGIHFNEDAPTLPAQGPNYDVSNTLEDKDLDIELPDNPEQMKRAMDYDYYNTLDKF